MSSQLHVLYDSIPEDSRYHVFITRDIVTTFQDFDAFFTSSTAKNKLERFLASFNNSGVYSTRIVEVGFLKKTVLCLVCCVDEGVYRVGFKVKQTHSVFSTSFYAGNGKFIAPFMMLSFSPMLFFEKKSERLAVLIVNTCCYFGTACYLHLKSEPERIPCLKAILWKMIAMENKHPVSD